MHTVRRTTQQPSPLHRGRPRRLGLRVALLGLGLTTAAACSSGGQGEPAGEAAEGATEGDAAAQRTLRVAHTQSADHAYETCGLDEINEALEAADTGLSLETFSDAQLGSNEDNLAALQAGDLDMAVPGVGSLSIFDGRVGVLELAFAYRSLDDVQAVMDGELGQEIFEPLRDSANVRVVGPLWALGERHVTADVPVRSPEDLAGLQLRSQDTPSSRATVEALGASATPINFTELYLALSQGVVDGQENPLNQIEFGKFQEVQDYVSMTGHVQNASALVMAESAYQSLSEDQQQALEDAADSAAASVRQCIEDVDAQLLEEWIEDEAIEVVPREEIDLAAFQENARAVYADPEYESLGGNLYDQVASD